jgi:RHS repeat-associated protein
MVLNPTLAFAGKTIWDGGKPLVQDRIGTNRATGARYYPFGDEITSTPNDATKFGTYHRDGFTGLDYADQRYYASGYGRFTKTDPSNAGALDNPLSLNLYSYVLGDPVNRSDPQGLCSIIGSGITQSAYSDSTSGQQEFADDVGAITATPFSNGTLIGGVANVVAQGLGIPTGATVTWLNAIALAAQTPGPISIYAFSGSGGAFTNAYNWLNPAIQARITNITYLDPGNFNQPLTSGVAGTNVTLYTDNSDAANLAVQLFGSGAAGTVNTINTGTCGHNENCVFQTFADQLSQTATDCTVGAGAVFGLPPRSNIYTGGFNWSNFLFWSEPAPVPSVTTKITYDLPL